MSENMATFSSIKEELEYFRNLASEYKKKWQDSVQELEEFQESSRELEAELEAQLEQLEMQSKELRAMNTHLQMEYENLKERLEISHLEGHRQISSLEHELSTLKAEKEEFLKYIRELEQSNDDLERGKRATVSSLEDFETKLNLAIERNAFLESELDEKETLAGLVQRLKDEARDLRQELLIHKSLSKPLDNDSRIKKTVLDIDSNKLRSEHQTQTGTLNKVVPPTGHTRLTPSARISALNIVGDLLRKIGGLLSGALKTSACKCC